MRREIAICSIWVNAIGPLYAPYAYFSGVVGRCGAYPRRI
jgi:hypothetical protein